MGQGNVESTLPMRGISYAIRSRPGQGTLNLGVLAFACNVHYPDDGSVYILRCYECAVPSD